MFVIKYDKVSMIKLVRSIERHPEVYDTTKLYSKEEQEAAWDKISVEVGEKDSLCRDRWHSIKSCYIRHLKYTALNPRKRPYYLAEYLNFMVPHFSEKVKKFLDLKNVEIDNLPTYLKEVLPSAQPYSKSKHVTVPEPVAIKEEVLDIDDESEEEEGWLDISMDNQLPSTSSTAKTSKTSSLRDVSGSVNKTNDQAGDDDDDKDINFFKSLLPEIGRMSSHQKLKFKQEALSTIEDILYATDYVNIVD